MKIYLASNYGTWPTMQEHAAELRRRGHEVIADWITGTHQADDAARYAEIDLADLDKCDAVIFFAESPPGSRTRGGKHVEFGYALAKGKRIFLVGTAQNVFHHLPCVVQRLTFADLLPVLGPARADSACDQ